MSYQLEISSKEIKILAVAVSIVPCLLYAAGFLTASLFQGEGQPQVAALETQIGAPQTAQPLADAAIDAEAITGAPVEEMAMGPETAPQALPMVPESVPVSQLFSVQAAAFHSASNAISYAAQLKAKGYPAEVAVLFQTTDDPIYKVVYGSFEQDEAAKAAIAFSQQEKSPAFIVARS